MSRFPVAAAHRSGITLEFCCIESTESECPQNVVVCTASREGGALASGALWAG